MSETMDVYDIIERHWPYDGPYSGDTVQDAAVVIRELIRYLNNATYGSKGALPYAATAYRVIAALAESVAGFPQLLGQLRTFMERQAGDPGLYDDRYDRDAAVTAAEVADELRLSIARCGVLHEQLQRAASASSHLGNR